MANKIKLARGTKSRIETIKETLSSYELVYALDTQELGVKNANGTVTYIGKVDTIEWTKVVNKPTFSTVATTGNYDDLSGKPDLTEKLDKDFSVLPNQVSPLLTDVLVINRGSVVQKTTLGNLLAQVDAEIFIVVSTLPTTGVANKIYLVPSEDPELQNTLDEFIWIDNAWERIGGISIDLSNYVIANESITGATKTKITYDSKGLVTSGDDLTESDIPPLPASKITQDANNRFVTDTEKSTWNGKQDKLVAGDNITIDENTNVISASGGGGSSDPDALLASNQVAKTPGMIGRVGVDNDGSLWYAPFKDDIIKVRGMDSLDSMVSYEGTLQPNLTHVDNGDIRVYSNTLDHAFPFNEMIESVDLFDNKFVDVPVIYWKFYHDTLGNLTGYDISNKKIDDTFDTFPVHAKGKLSIGKYQAYSQDGKLYSISAVNPSMSKMIASFRQEAKAVGDDYFSNDWQSWNILQLLLTAYFGTKNTDLYFPDVSGAKSNTGTMDGYKTAVNLTTGKNVFFGIENIVKNGYHFIDGVINNNEEVWFANDHTKYSNAITEDYVLKGTKPTQNGYIKNYGGGIGMFPTENTGASSTTYYCDYLYFGSGLRVLYSGSFWGAYAYHGVWSWSAHYVFSSTPSLIGSRLIKTS